LPNCRYTEKKRETGEGGEGQGVNYKECKIQKERKKERETNRKKAE